MKVLQVIDSPAWVLAKLADVITEGNLHLNIRTIAIHPKDLRRDLAIQSAIFENEVQQFQPDIIHFHYWDVANTLSRLPICKERKIILTHHNQKNLLTHQWDKIDTLVVHTQKARKTLEGAGYWNVEVIQHGIDVEKFKFKEDYKGGHIGYVGRICRWKGLKEIAKYAKQSGKKVICMGRIDKADYWKECQEYRNSLLLRFGTPDEEQVKIYHEMGVYVGNSEDNIEEGTMSLLEAMSCGIPVVTTPAGEAKDIINDENGVLVDFNYESLKEGLDKFFSMSLEAKNKMREKAWDTVRNMNQVVMARKYERLYYSLLAKDNLVSVIIPTYNRAINIKEVLNAYASQTYKPIELIVADDGSTDNTKEVVFEWAKEHKDVPLKYVNTGYKGYGLAKARNMAIFEASGHYLMFNDDRMIPDSMAVWVFVSHIKKIKKRVAVWGDKGAGKRDFIENFFIIRKKDIVDAGMFNERINEYGGQSQELRERLRNLDYTLHYEAGAKAKPIFGTKKAPRRYQILKMKQKLWRLRS